MLYSEDLPPEWSVVKLFLLHKKGDINNPENYRGISLINSLTKIFTTIICNRITQWCEDNAKLPESQSGFRRGRSCADNIFVLNALVGTFLGFKKQKLYCAFIDFRKAFDSVSHNILWKKLFTLGLSTKIIRICSKFYSNASLTVQSNNLISESIAIQRGVLQGDSLSPLLFSLFMADFDDFISNQDVTGVNIDHLHSIPCLFYADDLVLFANTPYSLQKALDALEKYGHDMRITVNAAKSKVVVFRRGGRLPPNLSFRVESEELEIVNQYEYLGVTFSSSGLFLNTSNQMVLKANSAMGRIRSLMLRTGMQSHSSRLTLYQSVVLSTLLYSSEIWSLGYPDVVEKSQVKFFKSLYCLENTTPGYIVRKEFEINRVIVTVIKKALRWLNKLLNMEGYRLPRICFERLYALSLFNDTVNKYNWASLLKDYFLLIDRENCWTNLEVLNDRQITDFISRLNDYYNSKDLECIQNSRYVTVYGGLQRSSLLEYCIPIKKLRLVLQLRTVNNRVLYFHIKGNSYKIDPSNSCTLCNMHEDESLFHILLRCPIYEHLRVWYLQKYLVSSEVRTEIHLCQLLLNVGTADQISDLFYFVDGAMKIRSFIINE